MNTQLERNAERAIFALATLIVLVAVSLVYFGARSTKSAEPFGIGSTPSGQDGAWELVFSDEFNGNRLDTDKWVTCYWWDDDGCTNAGNEELQWYLPDNVSVSDGTLKLTAREQVVEASDGNTYEYTSGMITTGNDDYKGPLPPKFALHTGYVEVRAKLPSGQGIWPAIWMLPTDFTSKPEFDIMEILGDAPEIIYMSLHYLDDEGERARDRNVWEGPDFLDGWHTYALDWQPDRLTWYIDGVQRWTYPNAEHVSQKTMYLLINLAIGGEWAGPPDAATEFPSVFEVDYVRVWQRTTN